MFAAIALSPLLAPFDPNEQDLQNRLASPGGEHLLGTDAVGRDTLSRLIYATRVDLPITFIAVLIPRWSASPSAASSPSAAGCPTRR